MMKSRKVIFMLGCVAALAASWLVVLNSKTAAEKQLELIRKANALTEDGIYILAVPLLEEAAGYDSAHTIAAEEELKKVYLELLDNRGFSRKYANLLEKQMARPDAPAEVFAEAAGYNLGVNAEQTAFAVLRRGIEKTADAELLLMYESVRYSYDMNRSVFEAMTAIYGQTAGVQAGGKWGIADTGGNMLIPCEYDKVSTLHQNRAVVMKDGAVYAVDSNNNRIAVAPGGTRDFRNFSENRVALLLDGGWIRATGGFELGESVFEDIGMYSGGYAPAGSGGLWGVISIGNEWLVPARYDEIICDELGRCYAQGSVFVRSGGSVYLYTGGERTEGVYQDARPFSDEGYAAVMQDGKWGFIDTTGTVVIDFAFDDALSFGGHLAAVKTGGLWGYVSVYGNVVIDAVFFEAKSFAGGSAPVLTEKGWQIITLTEYKKERTLI